MIRSACASGVLLCILNACTYEGSVGLVCLDPGAAAISACDDAMVATSKGQGACRAKRPLTLARRELAVFMAIDFSVVLSYWWMPLQNGFTRFIMDPDSDGVNVGLAAFSGACTIETYTRPAVAIAALPGHREQLQAGFPAAPLGLLSATVPRLIGAHDYARKWSIEHPEQEVVVLFVTMTPFLGDDCGVGLPDALQVAQARFNDPVSVPTWVLGLESNLDSLAEAGGSGKALLAQSPQYDAPGQRLIEMRDALRPIDAPSCRIALPDGDPIDLGRSRLRFTLRDGSLQTIARVAGPADCDAAGGGFYQRAESEATVVVCAGSCSTLRDVDKVDLLTECPDAEL